MEEIKLEQEQLQQQYDTRLAELRKIAQSPALTTNIMWNSTVKKYADTINRVKRLMDEKELKTDVSVRMIKQIQTFLDKCENPEFHIALVGVIKAGKSSLINALLEEELASTEVTPETAALTKFRRSNERDYVKVEFYSSAEWEELWKSASEDMDSKFMQEYRELDAESQKNNWIGKEQTCVTYESIEELKTEIKKWTSSQSATHYFVKEVTVGLKEFPLPDGIVLVDTPGLNDAVAYRSDITKNYIDRANAVLVCVKADKLTGTDLATISGVFSNTRYSPEKVYVIATQQDALNDPIEDWKKLRNVWLDFLKLKQYYGSELLASENLISTSGHFYTLLINQGSLSKKDKFLLSATAMKMEIEPEDLAEKSEELIDFTGIRKLNRILREKIVSKQETLLLEDIEESYKQCKENITELMRKISEQQEEIIAAASKDIDEIKKMQEENDKKLKDAEQDQHEFAELAKEIEKRLIVI